MRRMVSVRSGLLFFGNLKVTKLTRTKNCFHTETFYERSKTDLIIKAA